MSSIHDLTGRRFGRLVVVERSRNNSSGRAMWLCRCDCGGTTIVSGSNLLCGHCRSCGCLARKHGRARKERLYNIWVGMRQRCRDKNCRSYPNYGDRGIYVCKEWDDYPTFRAWAMSNGYSDELSIDRINPDGGYSSDNCRWQSCKAQNNNKTNNRVFTIKGKTMTMSEWADAAGVNYKTVKTRVERGWGIEDALMKKPMRHGCR